MDWFFPGKIGSPETIGIFSHGWGFPVSIFPGKPIQFRYVVFIEKIYIGFISKNAPPSPLLRPRYMQLWRSPRDPSSGCAQMLATPDFAKPWFMTIGGVLLQ